MEVEDFGCTSPSECNSSQLPVRFGGSDCSTSYKPFIEQPRDMPCWVFRAERPLPRRRGGLPRCSGSKALSVGLGGLASQTSFRPMWIQQTAGSP